MENLSKAIKKYRGTASFEQISIKKYKNLEKINNKESSILKIDDDIICVYPAVEDMYYSFKEGKLKYISAGKILTSSGEIKKGFALFNIYRENLTVFDENGIDEDANPRDGYIMISFDDLKQEDSKKLEEYGIRVMFDDDKNLRCIEDTRYGYFYGYSKAGDLHIVNPDIDCYGGFVMPEASYEDDVFYTFFKKYHGESWANEIRECLLSEVQK